MSSHWFYIEKNKKIGPISDAEFIKSKMRGEITGETFVWKKGMKNWCKLSMLESFEEKNIIEFPPENYLLLQENKWPVFGPFDKEKINKLYLSKRIDQSCYIYSISNKNWFSADDFIQSIKTNGLELENYNHVDNFPDLKEIKLIGQDGVNEVVGIVPIEGHLSWENQEVEVLIPETDFNLNGIIEADIDEKIMKMEFRKFANIKNRAILKKMV